VEDKMAAPGPTLREAHRLRRHLKDLKDQIDRLPRQLQAQQARVAYQEETLRQAQDAIKRLKVTTLEKEVDFKSKNQDIVKHQRQLNQAESKKEYEALQHEIAQDKVACQRLEDEILAAMEATEQQAAELPGLEAALKQAREEHTQVERGMESRRASLAEQLAQAQRQLQEVERSLPDDVRAQYERLIGHRGEDALSAVLNRTCTACYTEITAQTANQLLMGQFVVCKNCGRILYLPE
jgi:predicted  nucleic acid-binding Zn-ribbon protein